MTTPTIIGPRSDNDCDFETHSNIPFGGVHVVALAQQDMRSALTRWWRPCLSIHTTEEEPEEFDEEGWVILNTRPGKSTTELARLLWEIPTSGEVSTGCKDPGEIPISVDIELDYPLNHTWAATIELDAKEIGTVFGVAADMYHHIYMRDDQEWADAGHLEAPTVSKTVVNRAKGRFVYGHGIGDLVFEELLFRLEPGVVPFKRSLRYVERTHIGTIRFGIGS